MKKITFILFSVFTGIFFCIAQPKDTLRVLFVGNSYTFTSNMPQMISLISDYTCIKIMAYKSTLGGAKLSEH